MMITLYALDLENTEDAVFYQRLRELQVNIIPMNQQNNTDFKVNENLVQETKTITKIKVTTHIPLDINPNIKRQKINRIYDILNSKSYYGGRTYEENNSYICTSFC